MGNDQFDKAVDCLARGAAMGGGFEAIRTGKGGIVDGAVSGAFLGLVWRGAVVLADKLGVKEHIEKARDNLHKK